MARYGIDFYGVSYYGETPLIEFDARPVTAVSDDYGRIRLHWVTPSGDWGALRLTRDPYGFAPRADLGITLGEWLNNGTAPNDWSDINGVVEGKFYYYTIWVKANVDGGWRRAGDVIGLAVQDWGYRGNMFALVPEIYRDQDALTPTDTNDRGELERFLDIPGFQADHVRTELETLKWINDPDRVSGGLLPLMARQLGFGYEADLGMRLARSQMKNAVHIYKRKGTSLGIEALASVLTGWDPTVTTGSNLVLDQDDSSFENGTGRWAVVSNATLGRRSVTDATSPGVITGPVPPPVGASIGDIGSGSWMLLVTAVGAGDVIVQSYPTGTAQDNRQLSIPVVPNGVPVPIVFAGGMSFTYSVYSRALDTARSVVLGVEWFDSAGVALGALTEDTPESNATGSWTRHSFTTMAPVGAAFLRLRLRVQSASTNDRFLFDAVQVEQALTPTNYQSARSIRIQFTADRVNLVVNPSAEVNVTGWTPNNAVLVASATQAKSGTQSFRLTASSAATMSMQSLAGTSGFAVIGSRFYTASSWFFPSTTVRSVWAGLVWYDSLGRIITDWLPWGTAVIGLPVTEVAVAWTRASVTALSPSNAAYAAVVAGVTNPANAEIHYADAVLLEATSSLLDYFDGSTFSSEGEYIWDQAVGTPGNARSYFYARRLIKNYRLNVRLPEFLPAGSSYALLYAGQT